MIELISVPALLASPRYIGGAWLDNYRTWSRADLVALKALCDAGAPLEKSADALGRGPTNIAHRASETGLKLPPEWAQAIRKTRPSPRRALLQYPYIVDVRGAHSDLLQVNNLVPHGLPDHIRADVCQEIMLAVFEKKTSLDELKRDKKLVHTFIKKFRQANMEANGWALSLDTPMRDGRSWYDVLPEPEIDTEDTPLRSFEELADAFPSIVRANGGKNAGERKVRRGSVCPHGKPQGVACKRCDAAFEWRVRQQAN